MAADVIIVGAGAAGLRAARELKRAGKDVLVLEASDRIGGRIFTLYGTTAGLPVELGAEFIHGDAPETTRLLDEARLVTFPLHYSRIARAPGRFLFVERSCYHVAAEAQPIHTN